MEQPTGGAGPADAADGTAESLDRPLPEGVRRKVVALVSDAFGGLTVGELPAQLRQYARFTPSRRAKFAGNAMAAALESDPVFHAAHRRADRPDPAGAGRGPRVRCAARRRRPRRRGRGRLRAAAHAAGSSWSPPCGEEVQRAHAERADEETRRELERLREELEHARGQTRADTERLRSELDAARKEADSLHRKLRSALSEVKRGEAALRKAGAEADTVRAEAAAQVSAAESETRLLKARLAEAEASVEAGRRAAREGRSVEDMRLRLLLDTVLDAAQGLRRELALPPSSLRPADGVEAVEPGRMSPKDIAARALSETDPALLDQLLALPQAHLIVDGYNVTKTGYPQMPLEKQRLRLLGGLSVLAAQTGAEMTCVFDGAELAVPVLLAPPRGVRVLFSKAGVTADELIRQLARAEPPGRPVVVVSTDREVADGVAKAGARPVASVLLLKRLSRV